MKKKQLCCYLRLGDINLSVCVCVAFIFLSPSLHMLEMRPEWIEKESMLGRWCFWRLLRASGELEQVVLDYYQHTNLHTKNISAWRLFRTFLRRFGESQCWSNYCILTVHFFSIFERYRRTSGAQDYGNERDTKKVMRAEKMVRILQLYAKRSEYCRKEAGEAGMVSLWVMHQLWSSRTLQFVQCVSTENSHALCVWFFDTSCVKFRPFVMFTFHM